MKWGFKIWGHISMTVPGETVLDKTVTKDKNWNDIVLTYLHDCIDILVLIIGDCIR